MINNRCICSNGGRGENCTQKCHFSCEFCFKNLCVSCKKNRILKGQAVFAKKIILKKIKYVKKKLYVKKMNIILIINVLNAQIIA